MGFEVIDSNIFSVLRCVFSFQKFCTFFHGNQSSSQSENFLCNLQIIVSVMCFSVHVLCVNEST